MFKKNKNKNSMLTIVHWGGGGNITKNKKSLMTGADDIFPGQ